MPKNGRAQIMTAMAHGMQALVFLLRGSEVALLLLPL